MSKAYDAIIVGGGHNGLICAAYLAKAGRKVLVLEKRHVLGGSAVSEELYPGFTFSVCSYVVSLFRPSIIRDLELSRHGMEILPLETSYSPLEDDPGLCRWADAARSRREISRFSARDAEIYPEFSLTMTKMAQLTRNIIDAPAPDPTSWWTTTGRTRSWPCPGRAGSAVPGRPESPHTLTGAGPRLGGRSALELCPVERTIRTIIAAALLSLPVASGCGEPDPGQQKVDKAARIAKEIAKNPNEAEKVLEKHGMTNKEYQKLVFEITGDERLNELYNQKMGRK